MYTQFRHQKSLYWLPQLSLYSNIQQPSSRKNFSSPWNHEATKIKMIAKMLFRSLIYDMQKLFRRMFTSARRKFIIIICLWLDQKFSSVGCSRLAKKATKKIWESLSLKTVNYGEKWNVKIFESAHVLAGASLRLVLTFKNPRR